MNTETHNKYNIFRTDNLRRRIGHNGSVEDGGEDRAEHKRRINCTDEHIEMPK